MSTYLLYIFGIHFFPAYLLPLLYISQIHPITAIYIWRGLLLSHVRNEGSVHMQCLTHDHDLFQKLAGKNLVFVSSQDLSLTESHIPSIHSFIATFIAQLSPNPSQAGLIWHYLQSQRNVTSRNLFLSGSFNPLRPTQIKPNLVGMSS